MSETEEIGRRLKQARRRRNFSQIGIEKVTGLSSSHLSNLEKGKHTPSAITLSLLCYALDCSSDWVLGLTEEFKPYPRRKGFSAPTLHQPGRGP